jgi:hypothetical protein
MRELLSCMLSCVVLGVGARATFVQSDNFDRAARCDALQREVEWFERRMTGLEESIERFEFEESARKNAPQMGSAMRGVR